MKIQDITEGYGRYYCSTDKKWKTRKGPKQTRKVNEFAPDGFNGGDDGEEFSPEMAKMAYDEGVVKGASLADGATTQRAMAINGWDKHDGGMYSQHFAKGFIAGRKDKIRHNNKQYNLNLQLMKDGSIRHGEQGVAEGSRIKTPSGMYRDQHTGVAYSKPTGQDGHDSYMTPDYLIQKYKERLAQIAAGPYKRPKEVAQLQSRIAKLEKQGVAEGLDAEAYKEKLLATLPQMLQFYEKNVKGWKPSKEQMLAAVETGYTVMKHTGDVKQAGKAVMDELNTLHRMGQGQQGVVEEKQRLDAKCWDGYKKQGTKMKGGVRVNNCVKEELEETYDGDEFFEAYGELWYNEDEQLDEAEYQGRSVPLGKPMQGDVKKFKVYVKDPSTGNVKKVNFGDPDMKIRKSNPAARRSFRARHNCDNPGPRTKARYWSCRKW